MGKYRGFGPVGYHGDSDPLEHCLAGKSTGFGPLDYRGHFDPLKVSRFLAGTKTISDLFLTAV